jgi:hypothetical protein
MQEDPVGWAKEVTIAGPGDARKPEGSMSNAIVAGALQALP